MPQWNGWNAMLVAALALAATLLGTRRKMRTPDPSAAAGAASRSSGAAGWSAASGSRSRGSTARSWRSAATAAS